jgi:hypothetical protein
MYPAIKIAMTSVLVIRIKWRVSPYLEARKPGMVRESRTREYRPIRFARIPHVTMPNGICQTIHHSDEIPFA